MVCGYRLGGKRIYPFGHCFQKSLSYYGAAENALAHGIVSCKHSVVLCGNHFSGGFAGA